MRSFVEQGNAFCDEWTFAGTHTGTLVLPDGRELGPTGRRIEVKGMEYCQVRDGKLIVNTLYYDNLSVLAQLGLDPGGSDRLIARSAARSRSTTAAAAQCGRRSWCQHHLSGGPLDIGH